MGALQSWTSLPLLAILGALGLLCLFMLSSLFGRMVRVSDLHDEWLTDDEVGLARVALACSPPITCIELADRHHIFLDPEARAVERIWRGQTFSIHWDARLDVPVGEKSGASSGSPDTESR